MTKRNIKKQVKSPQKKSKSHIKKPKRIRLGKPFEQVKCKKKNIVGCPKKPVQQVRRHKSGKFKKGSSGNPNGRVPLSVSRSESLMMALTRYEMNVKPDPRNIWDEFVQQAFKDRTVLINLLKKLIPDLKSIQQISVEGGGLTKDEAVAIRREMVERFK